MTLIEKVARYIKHREPHFSEADARAAALCAIDEIASYIRPMRNDVPMTGEEVANTLKYAKFHDVN